MLPHRPRRNRLNSQVRDLIQEYSVTVNDLIAPIFVKDGSDGKTPINSMPGLYRRNIKEVIAHVKQLESLGIKCISLFPAVDSSLKSKDAKEAYNPDGLNQRAIKSIKDACPSMLIMSDIALDPYSTDGHDGLVSDKGEILNDETLEILAKMAIVQASCGSDIVGPSDMMDGRVGYIRNALDESGFKNTLIMSYTAKYASAFYGPFRDALDSAPKSGDKKTYQMNYSNVREALRELALDEKEGADIVMIKPGLCYLDVISKVRDNTHLPVAAYNVSGEYAMVKAADANGWIDGQKVMVEMLTGFKRAGADMILTYFAQEMATMLRSE